MTKRKRPKDIRPAPSGPQPGNAFGAPTQDWTHPDSAGHQFSDPFESSSVTFAPHLVDRLPEEAAETLDEATPLLMFNSSPLYQVVGGGAFAMVLTAATNDVLALLRHVNDLDGRSAAHAARALFEHAVTIHDLYEHGGPNPPTRYEAHQHVTRRYVAQRRWWLTLLPAKQRRQEEVRLDRMRREADAALSQVPYPASQFQRQWHEGNIFDRATRHGLADGYDGYRILSAVIHGSSGGLGGVMRQIDGRLVHRVGWDLDLVAIAYSEGLWAWREFARKLYKETARDEAATLIQVADELLTRLPEMRTTLVTIDKHLWPKDAPVAPMAMLALYGQGRKIRWFLCDHRTSSAIPAHAPAGKMPQMDFLLAQARTFDHDAYGGRPMTVFVADVIVTPVSGAKPIPLSQIAVPTGHPAMSSKPGRSRG